jgi:hypothetical protein
MDIFQLLDALHEAARKLGNRPVKVTAGGREIEEIETHFHDSTIDINLALPEYYAGRD